MTRTDYAHLVIISDRSGSMAGPSKQEFENGINRLVEEQAKQEGKCTITFCEFDDQIDFVHEFDDISAVKKYKLVPRGMTALNDAIGRTFNFVGYKLASLPENERPAIVSVIISTDGQENQSREFIHRQIVDMVKTQRNKFNWSITFLGADISNQQGLDMGLASINAVGFNKSQAANVYTNIAGKLSSLRSSTRKGVYGQSGPTSEQSDAELGFSEEEKESVS